MLVLMEKCKVGGNQKPFEISCRVLLSLCATMPSLYYGERVYELYQKQGFKNVMVEGAAMLMFGNCGELEQSKKIFENLKKDGLLAVIGWNTYIKCLTANSQYEEALKVFSELKEKIKPNSITIVAVLQACSYGGLVDAAREIWKEFSNIRNIIMKSCMVDVLSRNGFLDEAESLLRQEGTHGIFGLCSLLGACVNYKDLKRGLRIGHEIIQKNPNENFKTYDALIKLCEVCGENEEKMKIEALRKSNNPVKIIKKAEIEVDGKIHTFQQGNFSHPKSKEIRNKLHQVYQKLIKNGCDNLFPALWRTSPTLSTEAKINTMLYHHSEKVAICFGLISTPPGSVLRINAHDFPLHWRKHSAIKQIAKLYNRKILLRERSHVHCFTPDGECSCQDKPYQKAPEKQV
uniref:DYW domain-containing protein n=1 Tax=Arcella intermedia TaxID=1963864 RepID=A0A6B2L5B3_9EUKA